jgi:hypothetical protein
LVKEVSDAKTIKICENIIHTETKFKTAKLIKHLAHVPPAYELSIITF